MTSMKTLGAVSALAALGAVLALQPGTAAAQKKFHIKIGYATVNDPQHEMGVAIGADWQTVPLVSWQNILQPNGRNETGFR